MEINKIRNAKNVFASFLAIEIYAMHFFVPPYKIEEKYYYSKPFISEEPDKSNAYTRKLVKEQTVPMLPSTKPRRYTFNG